MDTKGKVVIAKAGKHSSMLEELRWTSYHNSESFTVVDDEVFQKFCKWTDNDESGIVLLALSNDARPLSTMRGNVCFDQLELEEDMNFRNNCSGFLNYPVLNMTFAATSPVVFKEGLNSVLRYYFYILHRHCVKSITGTGIFGSGIYKTLERLGYDFKFIDDVREDLLGNDKKFIAKLDCNHFDNAIAAMYEKYESVIKKYPLVLD